MQQDILQCLIPKREMKARRYFIDRVLVTQRDVDSIIHSCKLTLKRINEPFERRIVHFAKKCKNHQIKIFKWTKAPAAISGSVHTHTHTHTGTDDGKSFYPFYAVTILELSNEKLMLMWLAM